jgi:undecaprenyl-diphosphatase
VALPLWQACLLGAVQGLTEFLPVSSSGHLAIVQHFLSDMPEAEKVAIDVALHIGTLVAVVGYFRREIFEMAGALVGRRGAAYARTWIVLLFLGTLPAAVIGLALKDRIEAAFDSLPLIGGCFLVTGVLLFLASAVRGAHRTEEDLRPRDALVVGCFQAFALLPGVSRSGSTIAGALFRRARGDVAAKFSFLLSSPAIAGAVAVEGRTLATIGPAVGTPLLVGVGVSAATGVLAIAIVLRAVRQGKLRYFAYYCWGLGLLLLVGTAVFGVT